MNEKRVQSGCRSSEPTHTHARSLEVATQTHRQAAKAKEKEAEEKEWLYGDSKSKKPSTAPRNGVAPAPRKTASSPLRSPTRHTATKGRVSPLLRAPRGPRPNAVEGREEEGMPSSLAGQKPPLLWRRTSSSRRSCTRRLKQRTESGTPLCCLRGEAQRVERMAAGKRPHLGHASRPHTSSHLNCSHHAAGRGEARHSSSPRADAAASRCRTGARRSSRRSLARDRASSAYGDASRTCGGRVVGRSACGRL